VTGDGLSRTTRWHCTGRPPPAALPAPRYKAYTSRWGRYLEVRNPCGSGPLVFGSAGYCHGAGLEGALHSFAAPAGSWLGSVQHPARVRSRVRGQVGVLHGHGGSREGNRPSRALTVRDRGQGTAGHARCGGFDLSGLHLSRLPARRRHRFTARRTTWVDRAARRARRGRSLEPCRPSSGPTDALRGQAHARTAVCCPSMPGGASTARRAA